MVGPGHCPMISKYGPSLSKAVGPVDPSFLVEKKSHFNKLEDKKVLRHSPDLLNNVRIGQGQLRLIIQTYFVLQYMGSGHFNQVT